MTEERIYRSDMLLRLDAGRCKYFHWMICNPLESISKCTRNLRVEHGCGGVNTCNWAKAATLLSKFDLNSFAFTTVCCMCCFDKEFIRLNIKMFSRRAISGFSIGYSSYLIG